MPIRVTVITVNHPQMDVSRLAFDRVIRGAREQGAEARIDGNKAVHAYQEVSPEGDSVNHFREVGFVNHYCLFTLTVPQERAGSAEVMRMEADLGAMIASLTERAAGVQFSCDIMESDKELIWNANQELLDGFESEDAWEILQRHYDRAVTAGDKSVVGSIGLAFGELMRDEIPTLAWSVKIDEEGRDRALDFPGSDICTFPEAAVWKRFDRREEVNLRELAAGVIENLDELYREYASGQEG